MFGLWLSLLSQDRQGAVVRGTGFVSKPFISLDSVVGSLVLFFFFVSPFFPSPSIPPQLTILFVVFSLSLCPFDLKVMNCI